MEFGILGPLTAVGPDGPVALTAGKHRALLALLLLSPGEVVPADRIVDAVWGEEPPASAQKVLQVYVSQVRRALGDGHPIVTRPPGYAAELQPGALDLERFEALAARARQTQKPEEAARLLDEALALFRGPPLAGVPLHGPAAAETDRLDGLRLAALEDRLDAALQLGRHAAAVGELEALVAEHPYRERLRGQLMLALYRSGRQAEALAAFRRARDTLVEELGLEPSRELRALEAQILAQDPALDLAPAQSDLPIPATPLLGREQDLETASALLQEPGVRLLTLTGPGGIGKSRLALELARRHQGRFAALAPVDDAERVIPALAQALGVLETEDETPFAALTHALSRASGLLVVDNFEQVLDAGPELGRLLAAVAGLKLVVTSRAPLRIKGEHELAIPPLAPGAAAALFLQRARAVDPRTEQDAHDVEAICARLDGLPLAIELAAARTKILSTEQILARLERRLDLLTAGPRDAPARQQTLRAAIGWSHDLLDEDSRELFAELSVFAGGWTLEAAEAVCGTQALDGLAALADQSLVTRDHDRFGMLETVREYALERLGDATEVRRRHARAYVDLLRDAERGLHGPDARAWLARLDAERENVHAALEFAIAERDGETAVALAANVWRHWLERGSLTEGRTLTAAALALDSEPSPARVHALNGAGALAAEQGDFAAARAAFEAAQLMAGPLGDRAGAARADGNLGNLALYAGDHAEAVRRYAAAEVYQRESGNDWGFSLMLQNMGIAHDALGEPERALPLLRESLALARRIADPAHLASTLRTLGRVLLREDAGEAVALLHESLALLRDLDNRTGIAEVLETLAAVPEPATGARLLGAGEATRATVAAIRPPDEETWVAETTARLRAALPEGDYAAALAAGRALPLADAITLALTTRPAPR